MDRLEPSSYPSDVVIFNAARSGRVIGDKKLTNRVFSENSVPVPQMDPTCDKIFSNETHTTGAETSVVEDGRVDPKRYNTAFVDTRMAFDGAEYHTTVRLMCVGREIVHGFCRARPASESPSVHNKDTPLDAGLIEQMQSSLFSKNLSKLRCLAERIANVLGPGFYAHDILIEKDSGDIFICETGYKFNNSGYMGRLSPIRQDLPSHAMLFSDEFARRSASAFMAEADRLGAFVK